MLTPIGRRSLKIISIAALVAQAGGRADAGGGPFLFHKHHGQVITTTQPSVVGVGTLVAPQVAFYSPQVISTLPSNSNLTAPQVTFFSPQLMFSPVTSSNLTAPQVASPFLFTPQVAGFGGSTPSVANPNATSQVSPSAYPNVLGANPDAISFPRLAALFGNDSLGLHSFKGQVTGAIAAQKANLAPGNPGRAAAIKSIEGVALQFLSALPGAGPILGNADVQNDIENFVNNLVVKLVGGTIASPPVAPVDPVPPPGNTTAPTSSRLDIVIHVDNSTATPAPPAAGGAPAATNPRLDVFIHVDAKP